MVRKSSTVVLSSLRQLGLFSYPHVPGANLSQRTLPFPTARYLPVPASQANVRSMLLRPPIRYYLLLLLPTAVTSPSVRSVVPSKCRPCRPPHATTSVLWYYGTETAKDGKKYWNCRFCKWCSKWGGIGLTEG